MLSHLKPAGILKSIGKLLASNGIPHNRTAKNLLTGYGKFIKVRIEFMGNTRIQAKNKAKPVKEVLTFELEKELVPALKGRAAQLERSVSGHLRKLIKDDLKLETA